MTLETLKQIAALVAPIPTAEFACPGVSFGVDDAATKAIAALPGSVFTASIYESHDGEPYAIDGAEVTVDGVRFRAQSNRRPATTAEIAELEEHGVSDARKSTSVEAA